MRKALVAERGLCAVDLDEISLGRWAAWRLATVRRHLGHNVARDDVPKVSDRVDIGADPVTATSHVDEDIIGDCAYRSVRADQVASHDIFVADSQPDPWKPCGRWV